MTRSIRYLALGDSYTAGEGVNVGSGWPWQLSAKLQSLGIKSNLTVLAKTGWRTDELIAAIKEEITGQTFDLVSLLVGVNNQYQGLPIDTYRKEFQILLSMAVKLAGRKRKRVFILSIPDYSVTEFASHMDKDKISQEIGMYNLQNRKLSNDADIAYIDITDISLQTEKDPSLLASDKLHPSEKMYSLWTNRVWNAYINKTLKLVL